MPSPLPPVVSGKRFMMLCIPDDPLWIAAYSGVLLQLTRNYWWVDGATKEEVIALASEAFNSWLQQEGECMDWCSIVADCINDSNSPANQAVRNIASSSNGYPANERIPSDYANSNQMAGLNPDCDQDTTFGMCRAIVQMTNQLIEDFLEKFEAATNYLEISGIIASLPVLDELGIDVLTEYTSYMQSVLAENYSAQYTTDLENEMACGLFCLSQDTCELSIQQISDYFNDLLTLSLSPTAIFEDLITALIGAPLDGNYVVYSLFSLVWTGLRTGNIVLSGVGDKSLRLAFSVGAGDPSDDWELLCDACSPEYLLYDFTSGTQGFTIRFGDRGTYTGGVGFQSVRMSDASVVIHIRREVGITKQIRRVEADVTISAGDQQATPYSRFIVVDPLANTPLQTGYLAEGTYTFNRDYDPALTVNTDGIIEIDRWLYDGGAPSSGYAIATIQRLRLWFVGDVAPTDWGGEVIG